MLKGIVANYSLRLFSRTSESPVCCFIPVSHTFLLLLTALQLWEMSIIVHMGPLVFISCRCGNMSDVERGDLLFCDTESITAIVLKFCNAWCHKNQDIQLG